MNKTLLSALLLVLLAVSFSCKKDDSGKTEASFSAKVEGTLWTASNIVAIHLTGGNTTQISAVGSAPSEQIVLHISGSGTGTFHLNDDNLGSVVVGNYVFTSMFSNNPAGEIVITKYDESNKLISGTFTIVGEDIDGNVYHVTEGKFENVNLTIQ